MDAGACVPIAAKPSQRDNRMSSAQRWKRAERKIAALLGGAPIPNNGYGQPDVIAKHLAVQVKTKSALPTWLTDAVDQSVRDATADRDREPGRPWQEGAPIPDCRSRYRANTGG